MGWYRRPDVLSGVVTLHIDLRYVSPLVPPTYARKLLACTDRKTPKTHHFVLLAVVATGDVHGVGSVAHAVASLRAYVYEFRGCGGGETERGSEREKAMVRGREGDGEREEREMARGRQGGREK